MTNRTLWAGAGGVLALLFLLCANPIPANAEEGASNGASTGDRSVERAIQIAELEGNAPRARRIELGDRTTIYGAPMRGATTPEEAAQAWIDGYSAIWHARPDEVIEIRSLPVHHGRFVVFHYEQRIADLPVRGSVGRILVREPFGEDPQWQVVYTAALNFADGSSVPAPVATVSAEEARNVAEASPLGSLLDRWKSPIEVWWRGERGGSTDSADEVTIHHAWAVSGMSSDRATPRAATFIVAADDGTLLATESDIHHFDVDGTVTGYGSPGVLPDNAGNPAEILEVPGVEVTAAGVTVNTDDVGFFLITDLDDTPTTLSVALSTPWVTVTPVQGSSESMSESVTPPETMDFLLNDAPVQFGTAQINACVHTHQTHEFYTSLIPGYSGVDLDIPCFVNINDACNAFYSSFDDSINFFNAGTVPGGPSCENTAYAPVVAHEYGHFIVNSLGLAQGAFGEGFSDVVSLLQFDDPVMGRQFFTSGASVRNIVAANRQYPCGAAIHTCGMVIGGVFWDLRLELDATVDEPLEVAREIFGAWSVVTLGGIGLNSAHPTTAVEMLTIDDDDGYIDNGTPHSDEICSAFADHNINCPDFSPLLFSFPTGRPAFVTPDGLTEFTMVVSALEGTPEPDTGELEVITDIGSDVTTLTETAPNEYTVALPVTLCGEAVRYYLRAETTTGQIVNFPGNGPSQPLTAVIADDQVLAFDDDFDTDQSWLVGDPNDPDDANTGVWERVAPVGTSAQPSLDHTPGDGTLCWVTGQGEPGGGAGANDIDGGKTTLRTPVFDLTGFGEAYVSYWRWYSNDVGINPNTDTFEISISDDAGDTWITVETVGPGGDEASGGWFPVTIRVSDYVTLNESMQMRFVASDEGTASVVEAAIDDFRVEQYPCVIECDPLSIDVDPVSVTACESGSLELSVAATGTFIRYRWRKDGVEIPGAFSSTFTIDPVSLDDAGDYDVVVSDPCGESVTSAIAIVDVDELPSFTLEPVDATFCEGGSVTLTSFALGASPLTYSWRKDGVEIPGETAPSLTLEDAGGDLTGEYEIVATNDCGSTVSASAFIDVQVAPSTASVVDGGAACEGDGMTLSVDLVGSPPFEYQWRYQGSPIDGEVGPTLSLGAASLEESGEYDVIVSNDCGITTAAASTVEVVAAPVIIGAIGSPNVDQAIDFTLEYVSLGTLTALWDFGDGTTSTELEPFHQYAAPGTYSVSITIENECGFDVDTFNVEVVAASFRRGDVNNDGVVSALVDAVSLLVYAFGGGGFLGCEDAADVDDDGQINALLDATALLDFGFGDAPAPPAPGPDECGVDATAGDGLSCLVLPTCS